MNALEMEIFGEAADRASRGAAWLDAAKPGWEQCVTLPIDLLSDARCLLGQVFGSFCATEQRYGCGTSWAARHGFAEDDESVSHEHLALAWEALLYQRHPGSLQAQGEIGPPCRRATAKTARNQDVPSHPPTRCATVQLCPTMAPLTHRQRDVRATRCMCRRSTATGQPRHHT